jgi:3-dehydroquinate dehydratase-2
MRFLVLSGPNLNMLGIREPEIYGSGTYKDLVAFVQDVCDKRNVEVEFYQTNYEGAIIDYLQSSTWKFDGLIFNPAAYTHTSVAIGDAVKLVPCPIVEVHLSDLTKREPFRQVSYIRGSCVGTVMGLGFRGYEKALDILLEHIAKNKAAK